MPQIVRLTLLKITDPAAIQRVMHKYSTLTQDAKKNNNTYILSAAAHPTRQDARSQGYTMVARTVFVSKDDMDFYDAQCVAHAEIKALLRESVGAPPLVVYMDVDGEGEGE